MEPLPRGERRWERLVELEEELGEDPENPTPQPHLTTCQPHRILQQQSVSLVLSHWTENSDHRT